MFIAYWRFCKDVEQDMYRSYRRDWWHCGRRCRCIDKGRWNGEANCCISQTIQPLIGHMKRKGPPVLRLLKLPRVQGNQQLQKLLPRRHYKLRQRGSLNRMGDLGRRPKMLRQTMLWAKACQRTKSQRLKMILKKSQVGHRILMMKIGLRS